MIGRSCVADRLIQDFVPFEQAERVADFPFGESIDLKGLFRPASGFSPRMSDYRECLSHFNLWLNAGNRPFALEIASRADGEQRTSQRRQFRGEAAAWQ